MTTLIFVRHGESRANELRTFAGHLDIPLSDRGVAQANATADFVTAQYRVDKIYCSDLSRAYHTALPIAQRSGAPLLKTEKLREIYAGEWEGQTFDGLQSRYADSYGVWLADIGNAHPPAGESVRALSERVYSAVQEIASENEGKTVVIATHATPIRTLVCRLRGLDIAEMKSVPWVTNASVTTVAFENGAFTLLSVGEDKHLQGLATGFPANV